MTHETDDDETDLPDEQAQRRLRAAAVAEVAAEQAMHLGRTLEMLGQTLRPVKKGRGAGHASGLSAEVGELKAARLPTAARMRATAAHLNGLAQMWRDR